MKSHVNAPGTRLRLGHQVLGAVLADELYPAVGEPAELLDRHVLDRREDLHVGRVAPGGGDLGADALEVRPRPPRPAGR